MNLKLRITIMQFLQFFIWGAWLLTIGAYWFQNKQWSGSDFGAIFSTMGLSSLFMPALAGLIADRWMNAERLYGLLHLLGACVLAYVPQVADPQTMYWVMLINMIFYMPTLSLAFSISYSSMKEAGMDIVKDFPPIRVWGTVGFIVALWTTSLTHLETSSGQFYIASLASFILAIYSFTMPKCPPMGRGTSGSLISALGLDAFALFKNAKLALFFIFAMFLGAALQLTNAYGDTFLHDFANIEMYKDALAVKYPGILMSVSQISETLFILAIPFFLKRFGIKKVMLMSMIAWFFRFGLFAYGNPTSGLWMIILSMIIYGAAFDFFNISGSLFVESQAPASMRASGQGLFMMMSNGFGAYLGSRVSGWMIDTYFMVEGKFDWRGIWQTFALYSLAIAFFFFILFKHEHNPKDFENFKH